MRSSESSSGVGAGGAGSSIVAPPPAELWNPPTPRKSFEEHGTYIQELNATIQNMEKTLKNLKRVRDYEVAQYQDDLQFIMRSRRTEDGDLLVHGPFMQEEQRMLDLVQSIEPQPEEPACKKPRSD